MIVLTKKFYGRKKVNIVDALIESMIISSLITILVMGLCSTLTFFIVGLIEFFQYNF